MTRHWPIIAASVFALASADMAFAGSKKHKRTRAPVAVSHSHWSEPARMIEVRPGLIISSYDCVIDEGYGRYRLCSAGVKQ
jgi:hypothetical protein